MSAIKPYLDGLSKQVDGINTCAALAEFKQEVEDKLNQLMETMTDKMSTLEALSVPPVDLITTINWIKNQIELTIKPMLAMVQEIQEITSALTTLLAKITEKASTLGCNWGEPQ